jgi:hypothetical protein
VAITATGAAAHRAASTESIATASGPPRSTSSTTISRGEPDTRCLAALSSSRDSAAPAQQAGDDAGRGAGVAKQLRPGQAPRLALGRGCPEHLEPATARVGGRRFRDQGLA